MRTKDSWYRRRMYLEVVGCGAAIFISKSRVPCLTAVQSLLALNTGLHDAITDEGCDIGLNLHREASK